MHAHAAVDAHGPLIDRLKLSLGLSQLVYQTAYHLLEEDLQRDDTRRPAVLVHDDRHLLMPLLHLDEERAHQLRLRHEDGRPH